MAFHEQASEREIRALLQSLGGGIMDGPSASGFCWIEVPTSDPATLDRLMVTLRDRPDLIRFAESVQP